MSDANLDHESQSETPGKLPASAVFRCRDCEHEFRALVPALRLGMPSCPLCRNRTRPTNPRTLALGGIAWRLHEPSFLLGVLAPA